MQRSGMIPLLLTFCLVTGAAGHTSLRLRTPVGAGAEAPSTQQELAPEPPSSVNATVLAPASTAAAPSILSQAKDQAAQEQEAAQDDAQDEAEETAETREEEDKRATEKLGFKDIESSLAKLGGMKGQKATPGMTKFVTTVKGMIKDDMKPKIILAHRNDKTTLDNFKKGFKSCASGRKTSQGSYITLRRTKISASSAHKTCRRGEAGDYKKKDACDDLQDAKRETMKAACKGLRDLNRNPNTEANNCHAANKERFEEWLERNEKWFMLKNKEYKAHKAACKAAAKEWKKQRLVCNLKTKAYLQSKAKCDVKQDTLESAACNLGKRISQTCHTYRNCYSDNRGAYIKQKPTIKKMEKDRKGEWRVLMRVECLLDVFAEKDGEVDADVIDKCKNKTHDTTHLNLVYPSIPPLQKCKPLPPVPGTASFQQAEFSQLPDTADGKIVSTCVVNAGAGVALGVPKGVASARCSMSGGALKASNGGSCLLSDINGKPIKVDYTRVQFTTYSFKMKFLGNPGNLNRRPAGGFTVCNTDRKRSTRGRSPEFNFYDINRAWGYTFRRYPHSWSRYQNRNSRTYGYKGAAYPKSGRELQWDITMRWDGRHLRIYSWKVNGVIFSGFRNWHTNCWRNGHHDAFTPRVWAYGATKGVYIRDFRVYQGFMPTDMVQTIGTGIPRTPFNVACKEKGVRYSGKNIPGAGRVYVKNILECQKRCAYLSGCIKFTMYGTGRGWCYFYGAGTRKYKTSATTSSGPPVCDSPYRTGLKAEFFYYNHQLRSLPNLLHARPDLTRTDLTVWYAPTGGYWPGLGRHNYYASRWTGSMEIKQAGNYRFDITSDDGSFLWIDGRVVVSNPGLHGPRTIYRWTRLSAGWHSVMIQQFENSGGSNMYFRYYGPDTMFHHVVVPTEVLRPADKDKKPGGPFGTPDNKKYYKFPDQGKLKKRGSLTYLLLTVRAKNDAHISLFDKAIKDPVSRSGNYYEVVIGGWGDQRSRIRSRGKDVPGALAFPYTRNIVSKYEYRQFWISVDKRTGWIKVGKGHVLGKYTFMEWRDSRPLDLKSFAVMTGWSGTGEWIFHDKRDKDPKAKKISFGRTGFFMGKQGDDCTKTCMDQGRTCDPNIREGYSYTAMRAYVKEEFGATCQKDTRRWFAHNQPNFVFGGQDSNQQRCLGYSNIPIKVSCDAKHDKVMRWCKCSQTKMQFHIQKQNKLLTWDEMNTRAKAKGGRLMTLNEARLYIKQRNLGYRYFKNRDVWVACGEPTKKDWVQIGTKPHPPGRSHVAKYRYPRWGSNVGFMRKYKKTTFDYLMWVTERAR